MAFDINTAKPQAGGFDMSTAKPTQDDAPRYEQVEGDFIPTDENLAAAEYPEKPDRTIGESIVGMGETALTALTGSTGGALGFLSAVPGAVAGELSGRLEQGEGLAEASERAAEFTYEPKTEAGQEYTKALGEVASVLPPVLGTAPLTGFGGLPKPQRKLLSTIKSPLAKKIAEESIGAVKRKFTKKMTEDRFTPKVYAAMKEAKRQGLGDGVIQMIAGANPTDKRRFMQMVNILEKGKGDAIFQAENRPADVAGNSLLRKIDFVRDNNKKAGAQLGRVAKGLKGKDVELNPSIDKFISGLGDIGVTVGDDGALNFEGSRVRTIAPAKKILQDTFDEINLQGDMDALKAHEFKGFLDENVNFGKKQEGLSGKAERIVSELRRGVNEAIGEDNPAYKEANKRFSDTVGVIDELEGVVGKKLNMEGPNADKAFGVELRSLMNNTKKRANLMTAIDNVETVSKRYGGDFADDLLTQMLFADELDAGYGGGGRTSLKGEVKKANVDAAIDLSQMSIPGALAVGAKAAAKKVRGVNEKNQIKAIKRLLTAK